MARQNQAGSVSDEVVSQVDLAASFAKIIGHRLGKNEAIDSYDLLPVLKGEKYDKPRAVATVQNTSPKKFALRQGGLGLYQCPDRRGQEESSAYLDHFGLEAFGKGHEGLLFNLKEDPRQSDNLYAKYPSGSKDGRTSPRATSTAGLCHRTKK